MGTKLTLYESHVPATFSSHAITITTPTSLSLSPPLILSLATLSLSLSLSTLAMAIPLIELLLLFLFLSLFLLFLSCSPSSAFPSAHPEKEKEQQQQNKENKENEEQESTFIVAVEKSFKPASFDSHLDWYVSAVASVKKPLGKYSSPPNLLHTYDTVFHGFSARLTLQQASALEKADGVLRVFPDRQRTLHTTRSPQFLGLKGSRGLWPNSLFGSNVIVGVLDTGVWPERRSFRDRGMGPVPERWKGECEAGDGFNGSACNRKLIGARFFSNGFEASYGSIVVSGKDFRSPRDSDGHGTHTASTAAGRFVRRAGMFGFADGTARGVAPAARVAAYKVCWSAGCYDSDILAGFDMAVADGVDVISISVGGSVGPYYMDSIALGAFGAVERGVFVAASSGNDGPGVQTVTNVAPWIATVGAGAIDRDFPAPVRLGDGRFIHGVSLYSSAANAAGTSVGADIIYSGDHAFTENGSDAYSASVCIQGSLNPHTVRGKIVLCDRGNNPRAAKGAAVKHAGGIGMILANAPTDGEGIVADAHVLPATAVSYEDGLSIKQYIAMTNNPTAAISFQGTRIGIKPAPVLASFSSRGPNPQTPEILKPDLIAPGVNILAAWSGAASPTGLESDLRRVPFNIISGSSMACPHVSGAVALLKSVHPNWTPSAIKSSLMTTAYVTDNTGKIIRDESTSNASSPFDVGSGHIDPDKAMNPGLVYDIGVEDYINFMCGLNYTEREIQVIARKRVLCSPSARRKPVADLNYPSFVANLLQTTNYNHRLRASFVRTVTNVGPTISTFKAKVIAPRGVSITVNPDVLYFTNAIQKRSFTLTVVTTGSSDLIPGESETMFGALIWSDGKHIVRSPIAITWEEPF